LSAFWERHPNVTVEMRTAGSLEAAQALSDGDCDLAIAFDVRLPLKSKRLASAHLNLGALVTPGHPLARSSTDALDAYAASSHAAHGVRLRDFAGQRVLMADSELTLGKLVEDAALEAGVDFQVRAVTTSINVLVSLACAGHGVTFQTRVGVEQELADGRLVFLPLRDKALKVRQLSLMASAEGQLSGAPAALAAMLGKAIAAIDEAPTSTPVPSQSPSRAQRELTP
jgi:DNA-binding transcriptional LysR family regulator